MKVTTISAATAVALFLSAAAAYAQAPQKDDARPSTPQAGPPTSSPGSAAQPQERAPSARDQGAAQNAEPKGKTSKGAAQKDNEPQGKASKGTAQKGAEPSERTGKGSAERKDGTSNGAKSSDAKRGAAPDDNAARKAGTAPRAQLSEQQQTRVRDTLLKQRGERVTSVNFSISVGTAVPRSTRLTVVPAAIVEIVPQYRNYRYIVVRDDICIVDPDTYLIVDVIPGRSSTAEGGGAVRLILSSEQRAFILRNVDLKSESRLGIGGVTVGATVPRDAQLREFPGVVAAKIPEVRTFRYFAFENDLAIVDPRESKVVLVIEGRR